jgi:iron complex outermembrane receptor protein
VSKNDNGASMRRICVAGGPFRALALVTLGVALSMGLAGRASADAAAAAPVQSGAGLEEVIVTAQRRSEPLQDVPLSITALNSQALENRAATSFLDYASEVPGLAFGYTGDGEATARTISIRGISGDNTTGFYIDETPVPDSINPRVVDVDRIEVLRGPQGTLYGARSMGGTVRMITLQPKLNEWSSWVKVNGSHTQGAGSQNYGLDAVLNVPLIPDHMALRLDVFAQHDGGYFKRRFLTNPSEAANLPLDANPTAVGGLPTTTLDDVGRTNSFGGAGSLLIQLNDALSITPRIMFQKATSNGLNYSDQGSYAVLETGMTPPAPVFVNMHPESLTQYRFFNLPESSLDRWVLPSLSIKWNAGVGQLTSSTSYFDRTVDEVEDESDFLWQNLFATLNGAPDPFPTGPPYHAQPGPSTIEELKQLHEFVQEVRFVSQLSGPFQFVTGVFFQDLRGRLPYAGYYPPALAPTIPPGFYSILPVNPAIPDEIFGQDAETRVRETALYGEASYSFTSALKGTVGLRGYNIHSSLSDYLEGLAFGGPRLTDPEASISANGVNPKAELDYHIDADKMVYALAARGYRPGGLVPSIPGNPQSDPFHCFAQLEALGYTSAAQTKSYRPDYLWNYEAGFKTEWADHRLVVNASGYYIDWKNIQQLVALACGFQFRANAGAADVKGFDLELNARPLDNLSFSAGVGYQPARITETARAIPNLLVGSRVYQVPDWTFTASANYTISLTGNSSIVSTIGWSYTGDSTSAAVTVPVINGVPEPRVRPAYSLLDARIAYEVASYQFAFVGKNLTNTLADLSDNRSLAAETLGRPRLVVNQPRTLGVEVVARF